MGYAYHICGKSPVRGTWAHIYKGCAPRTRIRAGIRTDYVVVSPHIIRVRIHKILTLYLTGPLQGPSYLIGCFVPKHPDTLNPNGNSIIHSEAAHAASSFMWNRGPSGAPLP